VPIDPADVHNFDPNNVPTIHKLIEELDRIIVEEDGAEHHSGTVLPVKFSEKARTQSVATFLQIGNRRVYARTSSCWIGTYRASCAKFELQTRVSFSLTIKASYLDALVAHTSVQRLLNRAWTSNNDKML
jgi:hypothetical protein